MTKLQSRSLLVVILILVSLGLLAFGRSPWLEPVRNVVQWPLSGLQRSITTLSNNFAGLFQSNPDVEALRRRLVELEAENTRLVGEVAQLKENEAEVRVLEGLLNYARSQPENKYLAANLIGRDTSPFLTYLIFDRGSDNGVTRDMPVVTGEGLVGRVVEVTSNACKVIPITDPASAVAGRLQNSRETGMVVGQLGGGLQMQFITQQSRVEPGERVLTSGLGGAYPPGIIIGTLSAVQKQDYEVLQQADITPAVDVNRLEIVLIITNYRPANVDPFFQPTPAVAPTLAP
jgi:rod shape-determining protein MreC